MTKRKQHKPGLVEHLIISVVLILSATVLIGCPGCLNYFEQMPEVPAPPDQKDSTFEIIDDSEVLNADEPKSNAENEFSYYLLAVLVMSIIALATIIYRVYHNN